MAGENYTEKVSVNINASTLSEIDLLVDHGYYSNRSDFINQALRESLRAQQATINRINQKQEEASCRNHRQWFLGLFGLTNGELEEMQRKGQNTVVNGYGVLVLDENINRELLYTVVTEITVRGRVMAPADVKAHYGLK